ncbi:MAG: acetylglutamate kinase [Oscillospiraceae bacterium]|nr:acetylglutamate kinase [Oscillospiraceae bacterium]
MNMSDMKARAEVLSEALPYIRKFKGKTIVIKYGGAAMASEELKRAVISDIVLLSLASIRVVVVHGGGPEINALLERVGIEPRFIDGLRYTDEETMDVVQMVLAGKIGKNLAALIDELGGSAISLCGVDGAMIRAEKCDADYGLVGKIKEIKPEIVKMVLDNGHIPIISTVALGAGTSYNLNADTAASALAVALGAEKLILLTDVRGIMTDPGNNKGFIPRLKLSEVAPLIKNGSVGGGMIPKIECCVEALRRGVPRTHIIDGRIAHSILLELLSKRGVGTMIERD